MVSAERLLPGVDDVPTEEIPETLVRLGCLQSQIAALESGLVTRALVDRGQAGDSDSEDRFLSVQELSKRIGMSESWIYKHWRRRLPFGLKEGGRLVFPTNAVQLYINRGKPTFTA